MPIRRRAGESGAGMSRDRTSSSGARRRSIDWGCVGPHSHGHRSPCSHMEWDRVCIPSLLPCSWALRPISIPTPASAQHAIPHSRTHLQLHLHPTSTRLLLAKPPSSPRSSRLRTMRARSRTGWGPIGM